MDCVIPAHNIRSFSCAVGCLSRVGKEMYVEFDPLQGLTIRTLNDAKSAFASFVFKPNFFERCSVPIDVNLPNRKRQNDSFGRKKKRSKKNSDINEDTLDGGDNYEEGVESVDEKFICRVPLRTVHSILRPRKGLISLRIRNHESTPKGRSSQISSAEDKLPSFLSSSYSSSQESSSQYNKHENNNNMQNHKYFNQNFKFQLSFEFMVSINGILRITRRINVADCASIIAVAPRNNCSEIISSPKTFLKLLSPLKKTAEVALHIKHSKQMVSASSFHPADTNPTPIMSSSSPSAAAAASSHTLLKTETSMGCEEFENYQYRDDRSITSSYHLQQQEENGIPPNVNEEVTLVFGIKEVKAMLLFCSQANTSASTNTSNSLHHPNLLDYDHNYRVLVSFEWGGRPIIFETEGDHFSGELIMATLDYKLLVGFHVTD